MIPGTVFEVTRARWVGILAAALLGSCLPQLGASVAESAPITVVPAFDILDVRSTNTIGSSPGAYIFFGDNVVTPNGLSGTTGSAVTTNLATGQPVTLNVPFVGTSAIPNQFGRVIADDPNLRGPWTLTFQNGTDVAQATTPSLIGVTAPPFASNVTLSGSSRNPTFTWSYPSGSVDAVVINLLDRSRPLPAGRFDTVLALGLPGTATSFTVPDVLAGGLTLQPGTPYTIEIIGTKLRDPRQSITNSNQLAISRSYFDFTPLAVGTPVAGTGQAVSGTVVVKTPLSTQPLTAGTGFASGSLIQTGSDGAATVAFPGGTQLGVASNTQVTILPSSQPTGDDVGLSQIRGTLTHTVANPSLPRPDRYRVRTPIATVQPTGTAFSTQYGEASSSGALVVSVQQGQVEVANRLAQLTSLAAGQQASFSDAVPRVTPILPVDRGSATAGMVNTFSWTAFVGAAGYLFEFTFNPGGFAQANPAGPEAGTGSVQLRPGVFTESGGTVEVPVLVPPGAVPPNAQARWRVFPTNANGQILPGAVASDASTVIILGGRADVVTISPVAGAAVPEGRSATFSWTSFPGAAGYLFEFTLNPSGFARPNPSGPESPASTFRVMAGAFTEASGTVQITIPVPSGIAPPGTPAQWRIFPLDASGQALPGTTGSDASVFILQ